ncbi:MAG: RNase J family beta-CASP ribonuclease, partial [Actinomycetota bacterium]|nr:RNase J family beta-CASP ribonuclease [Actinomycetota bacterium]
VFVNGTSVGAAPAKALEERRVLAEDGAITVLALLDPDTGKLTDPIEYFPRGFAHDDGWTDAANKAIASAIETANANATLDGPNLERLIVRTMTNVMQRRYRSAPVITAIAVDA